MAGFDLYSNALADILSEPTLSTPITVGLYAKWGSGKSFLLRYAWMYRLGGWIREMILAQIWMWFRGMVWKGVGFGR